MSFIIKADDFTVVLNDLEENDVKQQFYEILGDKTFEIGKFENENGKMNICIGKIEVAKDVVGVNFDVSNIVKEGVKGTKIFNYIEDPKPRYKVNLSIKYSDESHYSREIRRYEIHLEIVDSKTTIIKYQKTKVIKRGKER